MKKIILLLIIININIFAKLKYEDISNEHWAYTSIESLVKKGIIVEDTFKFDGEKPLSRYDFAIDLSRAIDYMDLKKASKEDLDILESLMFEFSNELNKIGFDASTFNTRLNETNETIELLRIRISENEKIIEDLKKRVQALEDN